MRILTPLIAITMLLNLSCGNKPNRSVTITDFNLKHQVEHQTDAVVLIDKKGNQKEYIIKDPKVSDSLTLFIIKQDLNNDSYLMHYDDTLELVNKKNYLIDGKYLEVKKYFSDAGGIGDGEYLIYFNDELGMIALQSQAWGNYQLVDYEEGRIGEYLKKDSIGFFHRFKDTPLDE